MDKKLNIAGGLVAMAMVILFFGIGILIFFGVFFSGGVQLPEIKIPAGFVAFWVVVNFLAVFFAFAFARKLQWRVQGFLDDRLLPRIREIHEKEEKSSVFEKVMEYLDPDFSQIQSQGMTEKPRFGIFQTKLGEEILGGPFFPSWMATTVWNMAISSITVLVIANFLALIPLILGIYPLTVVVSTLLLICFSISILPLRYWSEEWKRHTEFFFVTTHQHIHSISAFSWIGFLFKRGGDIEIRYTPITSVHDIDVAGVPRSFGFKIGGLYKLVLQTLSYSQLQVGTVIIRNIIAVGGQEVLLHYSFAPFIKELLYGAKDMYTEMNNNLNQLARKMNDYISGQPGVSRKKSRETLEREARRWFEREITELGYPMPRRVDIIALRSQHLDLGLSKKQPPPTVVNVPRGQQTGSSFKKDNNPPSPPLLIP